jgi:hypothetical protein
MSFRSFLAKEDSFPTAPARIRKKPNKTALFKSKNRFVSGFPAYREKMCRALSCKADPIRIFPFFALFAFSERGQRRLLMPFFTCDQKGSPTKAAQKQNVVRLCFFLRVWGFKKCQMSLLNMARSYGHMARSMTNCANNRSSSVEPINQPICLDWWQRCIGKWRSHPPVFLPVTQNQKFRTNRGSLPFSNCPVHFAHS